MTTARDLREHLARTYSLDAATGVWSRVPRAPFAYSDGAAAEARVAAAIRAATDRSVGSEELAREIRDWPSLYHLSPERQNLLRPALHGLKGLVLEIGAGCGAITRQLGENGATVLAVEGSFERAATAAARCKDLPDVIVLCDNFRDVELPFAFDAVTLIGVLEYARLFLTGDDPVQSLLERARDRLAGDGILALAIENQLGLKYLAGAREDHTGLAYFGVTDQYGPGTPVTFGERELRGRLARAGFGKSQFLYPFPDYKLPSVTVSEAAFSDARFNVGDLVATTTGRRHPHEGPFAYSETRARDVFLRNGLGTATANSFLVLSGRGEGSAKRMADPSVLAWAFSARRKRHFAKESRFVAGADGVRVIRKPLYAGVALPEGSGLRQRIADEAYERGEVLFRGIERIVMRRGWSVEDLAGWLRPWAARLAQESAGAAAGSPGLPPAFFDATPFNMIRRESDGALVPFDLEWEPPAGEAVPVARVLFRGLWNSLARVDDAAPPRGDTPVDLPSLTGAVLRTLGHEVSYDEALGWIRAEYAFSNEVSGRCDAPPTLVPDMRLAGFFDHANALPPRVASGLGGAVEAGAMSANFRIQAYYRAATESYGEERSVSVSSGGESARVVATLPLPARVEGYDTIRLDPMDIPGLVRLERVTVTDGGGEVLWETRRCASGDFRHVAEMRSLESLVASRSGTVWFMQTSDPHLDLPLDAAALPRLASRGGTVLLEMSRLEASELTAVVTLAAMAAPLVTKRP